MPVVLPVLYLHSYNKLDNDLKRDGNLVNLTDLIMRTQARGVR